MSFELHEALLELTWPSYVVNVALVFFGMYLLARSVVRLSSRASERQKSYVSDSIRLAAGIFFVFAAMISFLADVVRFMPARTPTCYDCIVQPRIHNPLALSLAILFIVGVYYVTKGLLGLTWKGAVPIRNRHGMMARLAAGSFFLLLPSMMPAQDPYAPTGRAFSETTEGF